MAAQNISHEGENTMRARTVAKTDDFNVATSRRRAIKAVAGLLAGIAAPGILRIGTALAAFPDRAVKIVVANSPGGPSDIVARLMAASLQQAIGGSFIVENKGGAGGNIGMGTVARADPDGYTLLITTSAYVVNPGLYNSLPYDPFSDFVAIAELASTPNVFAVKPELGAKTMKGLVALAKADPDKFNVSTPPVGTTPYLAIELLKMREGLSKMPIIDLDEAARAAFTQAVGSVVEQGYSELPRELSRLLRNTSTVLTA
jgi:tripartite-type tricarboxylate transporter receptor subunit TctC